MEESGGTGHGAAALSPHPALALSSLPGALTPRMTELVRRNPLFAGWVVPDLRQVRRGWVTRPFLLSEAPIFPSLADRPPRVKAPQR